MYAHFQVSDPSTALGLRSNVKFLMMCRFGSQSAYLVHELEYHENIKLFFRQRTIRCDKPDDVPLARQEPQDANLPSPSMMVCGVKGGGIV